MFRGDGREFSSCLMLEECCITDDLVPCSLWYDVPWLLLLITLLYITLPDGLVGGNTRSRIKMIDWVGLFISVTAIVLLVVRMALFKPACSYFNIFLHLDSSIPGWLYHIMEQCSGNRHVDFRSIRYIHLPNC